MWLLGVRRSGIQHVNPHTKGGNTQKFDVWLFGHRKYLRKVKHIYMHGTPLLKRIRIALQRAFHCTRNVAFGTTHIAKPKPEPEHSLAVTRLFRPFADGL